MNSLVWVCLFSILPCFQTEKSNEIPLDSILMTESLLNPKEGLFSPKSFLLGKELCKSEMQELIRSAANNPAIVEGLLTCNRTLEGKRGLDFKNEVKMKDLCEGLEGWGTCGRTVAPAINLCFQKYTNDTSKGNNDWVFTEKYSNLFCKKRSWFLGNLLEGDKLICSTPQRIKEINECNRKVENYLASDSSTVEHDPNEICLKFRTMEICVNQSLKGQCNYEGNVMTLVNELKHDLDCKEYDFTIPETVIGKGGPSSKGEKGSGTSKSSKSEAAISSPFESPILLPCISILHLLQIIVRISSFI